MSILQHSGAVSMAVEPNEEGKSNIVTFRAAKNVTEGDLINIEASLESARSVKEEFCDEMVEFMMDQIDAMYQSYGVNMHSRRVDPRDRHLVSLAVQGLAHRFFSLEHVAHQISEQAIQLTDSEGNPIDSDGNIIENYEDLGDNEDIE